MNIFTKLVSLLKSETEMVPNPTDNSFILSSKDMTNMNYSLVDIQGKIVFTSKIESSEEIIDISKLSKGQYNLIFEDQRLPVISVIKK